MNPHLRAIRISIEIQATRESRVNISIAIHLTRDTYVVYPFDARLQSGPAFVKRISQTCDTAVEVSAFHLDGNVPREEVGVRLCGGFRCTTEILRWRASETSRTVAEVDRVRTQIAISSNLPAGLLKTLCHICIVLDNMVKHLF